MAKKHKKIFKQKIKEMLSQADKMPPKVQTASLVETKLESKPEPKAEVVVKSVEPEKTIAPQSSSPSMLTASLVKSDLKKIALLFLTMILVVILSAFISSKTNWLFFIADKIYNWARLGS